MNRDGNPTEGPAAAIDEESGFAERVRIRQQKLMAELKPHYEFIARGSGSSGSIIPRITIGNTMAPCAIAGERAGGMLGAAHGV